ncbi:cytochrome c [Eurytemora carolleeae]|uniref:cytochrome c n=1 Tax=Eurytemora carolleeae TaxID=1294199 RepID=UPI000C77A6D3|nr:cytochrome c [Eurytemora carolleeae]|eukprot:XP_023342656.1 cytochrome c-like [Eurytemora affinis]
MSAEKGRRLFKKLCSHCHNISEGESHKYGPNLFGVFGKQAGSVPGYHYSEQHKNSGLQWTESNLNMYLENFKETIPGSKKKIPGVSKEEQRKDLIEFIKTTTNV